MKNNRRISNSEKLTETLKESTEQENKQAKMVNNFRKELKTNPIYKEFFEKYNPISVESFIDNYSLRKSRYLTFGEMLSHNEENVLLRQQLEADERLWEIQKKKLFDLECLWRAEQIAIPEIEISADFEYWNKNIENCPFLEPISDNDFELYHEYLLSDGFYDFHLDFLWMSYTDIKQLLNEESTIPPWYEFYDNRKGTGQLLFLSDIKGEKEEYYLNLWRRNISSDKQKSKRKSISFDPRPHLYSFDLSVIEEFIRKYENEKVLGYFRLYEKELNKSNDEIDQAIRILKEADEIIPIENHYDWKYAVIQAARKYEQRKIAEACRQAYSKYRYRNKVGIAHEAHTNQNSIQWITEWIMELKAEIIKARKMVNEPGDLNF